MTTFAISLLQLVGWTNAIFSYQVKSGEVKKLEDSIRNVRTSAQNAVEEKEFVINGLQQKLKTAEHVLEQKKNASLEADSAKIKDLEEQCIKLQESKKEVVNKFNSKKFEMKLKAKEEEVAALKSTMKEAALRISFDDISLSNYRIIFKISYKYRYRIFFENITRY